MTKRLIVFILIVFIFGCKAKQSVSYSWPIGKEAQFLVKINREIETFNKEISNKYKSYQKLELQKKIKKIEIAPNGMKIRITFINDESNLVSQDDFNQTFAITFTASYELKSENKSNQNETILPTILEEVEKNIVLRKEDF